MFMNLAEMKVSNTNIVNVTDSLKAPLLKLSVKNNSGTTIPTGNDLIIYVDKSSEVTSERKSYLFTLTKPLQYASNTTDEFIVEPVLDGNKVTMKTYVKRLITDGTILSEATIEELDSQSIVLFEGSNYISTNYGGADISIVYPKNNDLALYFLNNAIYGHNNENKVLSLDDIYFKDCFTEVDDGINATFNKITIKCMDSTNGNFSLDCDGNLVVNTLTERTQQSSNAVLNFDSVYPIGSIYMSVASVNPSVLFGGSWEQIKGRFLIGQGENLANTTNYWGVANANEVGMPAGEMGGEYHHTLTVQEMPSHDHQNYMGAGTASNGGSDYEYYYYMKSSWVNDYIAYDSLKVKPTGGGSAHCNMPPYLVVYMWKRIA